MSLRLRRRNWRTSNREVGGDMASERTGVYPGTFDPVTSGHMEVMRRSLKLVDRLVIGPATNIGKGPLFSLEERIDIIKDDIADFSQADRDRIKIVPFDGLLIHFARDVGASMIIRGLRAVSDFEYEIQMANMNARMEPNIETIFLMASDRHQFISSSLVKDIARLGGDTSQFVSKKVFERLKAKFKRCLTAPGAALTVGPAHHIRAPRGVSACGATPERARSSAVEHLTFNQVVVGSIPTGLTTARGKETLGSCRR